MFLLHSRLRGKDFLPFWKGQERKTKGGVWNVGRGSGNVIDLLLVIVHMGLHKQGQDVELSIGLGLGV